MKQPRHEPSSQAARASAPYRADDAAVLLAVFFGDHVLGLDDRRFELGELRLLSDRLVVDLLLERGDLAAEPLRFGFELRERGRPGLDSSSETRISSSIFDLAAFSWAIWFWRALYSSFFLTRLSLIFRSSILVSIALKRVFVLLELNLGVLECLALVFQLGLSVGEGRLADGQGLGA